MSNLSVEALSRIVQNGQTEELFTGGVERTVQPDKAAEGSKSFSEILTQSLDKTNQFQHEADTAIKELVAGRNKNIHETMLTVERADTSLKLMMQVRNKILDAYREIMRMQV